MEIKGLQTLNRAARPTGVSLWRNNGRGGANRAIAMVLGAALASSCQAAPSANPAGEQRFVEAEHGDRSVNFAQAPPSRRFASLDDYLAYLKRAQAPVDGPWYREIRPGVYELQTGNLRLDTPRGGKRVYSRSELAAKFGFKE